MHRLKQFSSIVVETPKPFYRFEHTGSTEFLAFVCADAATTYKNTVNIFLISF